MRVSIHEIHGDGIWAGAGPLVPSAGMIQAVCKNWVSGAVIENPGFAVYMHIVCSLHSEPWTGICPWFTSHLLGRLWYAIFAGGHTATHVLAVLSERFSLKRLRKQVRAQVKQLGYIHPFALSMLVVACSLN